MLGLAVADSEPWADSEPILIRVPATPPGLIQSVSKAVLPRLRAWDEVGGIAPS
jgi:hypothetical protein